MNGSEHGEASASGSYVGTSVLQECLRIQSETPPRSALAAFFGRSPVHKGASGVYVAALGQVAVSSELRGLGPGWTVLQTVPAAKSDAQVAHLVIGPPGVFSIATVVADGRRVTVASGALNLGRHRSAELPRARTEAERVAETLSAIAGAAIVVTPIVAIVGASIIVGAAASTKAVTSGKKITPPKKITPTKKITQAPKTTQTEPVPDVLSSNRLVRWLSLRPTTLTSAAVVGISTIASTAGRQVVTALSDDDARAQHRFERLRREVEIARSRRRGWVIAACATLVSGVAVGVLATLGVVSGTVAAIAEGLGGG